MIHLYDPRTMSLPYVQEMDLWQRKAHDAGEPLINVEWDVEYAPEVYERFLAYVKKEPDRPHVAPYLTNIYFALDGQPILFWAHRMLKEGFQQFHIEESFRKMAPIELKCQKCDEPYKKTVNLTLKYAAWMAGGEPEADIVCLGFTYLPFTFWERIYPEIKQLPWNVLDVEISARMVREGFKARVHWDCIVNHNHVDIREQEKSLFRKWIGVDHNPLTEEERKWVKMDTLPRYHGMLGERQLLDKPPPKP